MSECLGAFAAVSAANFIALRFDLGNAVSCLLIVRASSFG
jgi:hypothetical protein